MANNPPPPRPSSELLDAIKIMILVGACAIALYAISKSWTYPSRGHIFQILAVATGISAAALVLGGLLGFLFSIPRAGTTKETTDYLDNSNLVDISDWLTKILVGAGLVTLTKIPTKLGLLADYLGNNGFSDEKDGAVFALILVLFNGVCGFLWVYVWTRLNFPRDLTDSRNYLKSLLQAASESPVATLLLRALALPPAEMNEEAKALRAQAEFMGRTELSQNPESRKIAIQYARLLEEQFQDRKKAIQVLIDTIEIRRKNNVPPDTDDAALHFNLACYFNRDAKAENDVAKKEKLRSEARKHLRESIKLDEENRVEAQNDPDINDLTA